MKKEKLSFDEMDALFNQILGQVADKSSPLIQQIGDRQAKRTERLIKINATLKESWGDDHPRLIPLRNAIDRAEELKSSITTTAIRESRRPRVSPQEWMAFGTVIDSKGEPVSGLRVRVYDKDRKYDDLLGETETDEYGDFYIKYHERMFTEIGEKLPELYIMVEDRRGKQLYSSRDSIRRNAGQASYFKITLKK